MRWEEEVCVSERMSFSVCFFSLKKKNDGVSKKGAIKLPEESDNGKHTKGVGEKKAAGT